MDRRHRRLPYYHALTGAVWRAARALLAIASLIAKEPPPFCYAFAQNYKAIKYYRLDPPGFKPKDVLVQVRRYLLAGLPTMFGFSVYTSIPEAGDGKGEIPFPHEGDSLLGGHAVLAVGFDDQKKIGKNKARCSSATLGAHSGVKMGTAGCLMNTSRPGWQPISGPWWTPVSSHQICSSKILNLLK
jgi:hypothetical protein